MLLLESASIMIIRCSCSVGHSRISMPVRDTGICIESKQSLDQLKQQAYVEPHFR